MPKARVIKKESRCYVELPGEFMEQPEIELFRLRDGYYLLSVPLGRKPEKAPVTGINAPERELLRRLMSIKFERRTPQYVKSVLSQKEKELLSEMEKKKLVNVFTSRKYPSGVYNIPDKVYPLLKGQPVKTAGKQQEEKRHSLAGLGGKGYMIVNNAGEARELSNSLKKEMKSGDVMGIKGFDGKFYVVTREYYEKASTKVLELLKESMDAQALAKKAGLEPGGCNAVLNLLSESGDVIEKKKGTYTAV